MDKLQKRTAKTFDSYVSEYSDAVNSAVAFTSMDVDFFTRVKADYIGDLAEAHFSDMSNIDALDIGCGVGNYHHLLGPRFRSLNGVDVSEASIEKARERHQDVTYSVYSGGRLPYDDNSFDIAFTICVMHHVPPTNWRMFASEMNRVIKPDGLGLIFEHNPANPLTMHTVNNCPFDKDAVLLRSSKTISLLEGAGFANVKSRFILSVPPANGLLRRVDRLFSLIPFGAQYYVSGKKVQ